MIPSVAYCVRYQHTKNVLHCPFKILYKENGKGENAIEIISKSNFQNYIVIYCQIKYKDKSISHLG